ncbi:hypothetical protein BD770DRAFT_410166 [Pilaira anomala]|nr:hypothetical protein BD770DRAFT_410166 [Pilaira anomala]
MATPSTIVENDFIFIQDLDESVGTKIKNEAVKLHPLFHELDPDHQSVICLGLNSILDLSAAYPNRQTLIFNKKQWAELQKLYPAPTLNDSSYLQSTQDLIPIFNSFSSKKSFVRNWNCMYSEVLRLQGEHNAELNEEFREIDFCLFFYKSLLIHIKHHPYMFSKSTDNSEWDFLIKFWGPVMERLYLGTGLRLKWGDTTLTMKDVGIEGCLKVDMKVMKDDIVQRFNQETDLSTSEAAKDEPGSAKFNSDRCKLLTESKVIIDNFLHDNQDVGSVYSIQFCGLDITILSLSLSANGLYVGNEIHHAKVDNRLESLVELLPTLIQLLCFRDEAVKLNNEFVSQKSKKVSPPSKSSWKRGTWIPPRCKDAAIPTLPSHL